MLFKLFIEIHWWRPSLWKGFGGLVVEIWGENNWLIARESVVFFCFIIQKMFDSQDSGRGCKKKSMNLQDPSFSSEDFLTQKACVMLYEDTAT